MHTDHAVEVLLADRRSMPLGQNALSTRLSPSSQTRLATISTTERRQQFLLGRWLIAQAAGCEMTQIEEGARYPVFVHQPDWHASISHSGPYVAVVVSQNIRLGLDIEFPVLQRNWLVLAKRAFAQTESIWVMAAPAGQQVERFLRIWTLREAAFKAGLLPRVTGDKPVFDTESEQACLPIRWQYLRQGNLHLSLAGVTAFSPVVQEITKISSAHMNMEQ